jgi:hypothetical protein
MTSVEILRSWPGGPLREFATTRPTGNWGIPYQSKERQRQYANRYVCDACQQPSNGVYSLPSPKALPATKDAKISTSAPPSGALIWLCGRCRDRLRPKEAQPEQLRRAK